jgi:predicted O-methyltransferase YrrM
MTTATGFVARLMRGEFLAHLRARTTLLLQELPLRRLLRQRSATPDIELISAARKFSMLHDDVLRLLWTFAETSRGAVLELGPYIGGSTVVIASAARKGGAGPVVTVEKGGAYRDHPHVPTDDILGDLRKNLNRHGVLDAVHIVEGENDAPESIDAVRKALGGAQVDLFFVDSDGRVDRDFRIYEPYLMDNCIIMFDDYESDWAAAKARLVRPWVDAAVASGKVRNLGVYGWGTWVGQYLGHRVLSE